MKWLRAQFCTFEAIFVWWRENLTLGGKTLTLGMLLCLPGLISLDSPLFLLFSAQLSLLLAAGAASYWFRPRLKLRILAAPDVPCGETVDLRLRVENRSAQTISDLSLELVDQPAVWERVQPRRFVPLLAGGGSTTVSLTVRPLRRGVFPLAGVRCSSTFPLNLFRLGRTNDVAGEVTVLPNYLPLASLDLSRIASKFLGEQLHDAVLMGHGGDYAGSREYLPGSPVRRWDYCSWARLGQPVVRQFTNPEQPTCAIVVDDGCGRRASSPQGEPVAEFEAAVSLAAALSEALTAQNHQIVQLVVGDRVQAPTSAGLRNQHSAVLRMLAAADAAADERFSLHDEHLVQALRTADAVFVLLASWDRERAEFCDRILAGGSELTRIFLGAKGAARAEPRPGDVVVSLTDVEAGLVEIA